MTQTKYPKEYIDYLVFFHTNRDFFECHEILEEYWKQDKLSGLDQIWLGLIQVAVGLYHQRRNNFKGARKMISSAIANLSNQNLDVIGVDASEFQQILKERLNLLEDESLTYSDINIPIKDPALLQLCINECTKQNSKWEEPSNMLQEAIIHKHLLRDRTEVIRTRLREKEKKKLLREQRKNMK